MQSEGLEFKRVRNNDTIILIHGAWHGSWCFDRIIPTLQALGHKVIAPDLPGHGNSKENMADQTLEKYVAFVLGILDAQPEPVILAGHSMAGMIITEVAERRPEKVKKLVYMNAFLPLPGQSAQGTDGSGITPKDFSKVTKDGYTQSWATEVVRNVFGQNCSELDKRYILEHLNKLQAIEPLTAKVYPTAERWGSVRRFFIAGACDIAMTLDKVKSMLVNIPCEEVYAVEGDHEIFCSAPDELAFTLHTIALKD